MLAGEATVRQEMPITIYARLRGDDADGVLRASFAMRHADASRWALRHYTAFHLRQPHAGLSRYAVRRTANTGHATNIRRSLIPGC